MKLKRLPEDFQVEELSQSDPSGGPFALYRLTKQSIGTPEVLSFVVDYWKIPRRRISYGGLKDRHALTTQFITIQHGPKKPLTQRTFELEYLGQTGKPFTSHAIDGNRFTIVMRDLSQGEVDHAVTAAEHVRDMGLPNYFDDQRFGSLGFSGEWVARAWCQGDWERALWLALAEPHKEDRSSEKAQKQILHDLWGSWVECKEALERSHRRSIVTFLADKEAVGKPIDFRGAFGRISVDLRGLYLSAFQSALWNRMLDRWLRSSISAEGVLTEFELKSGTACFVASPLDENLLKTEIPFPSARLKLSEGPVFDLISQVLAEEDLQLRQMRIRYPKDSFFSKANRRAIIRPKNLQFESSPDELHDGRQKLTLRFDLPRGSYATILVKRLTLGSSLQSE